MTTCLGKSCSFGLPRVPFVNCCQFIYLVISFSVLRAGCGIWLYRFQNIAYLFTLFYTKYKASEAFSRDSNYEFDFMPRTKEQVLKSWQVQLFKHHYTNILNFLMILICLYTKITYQKWKGTILILICSRITIIQNKYLSCTVKAKKILYSNYWHSMDGTTSGLIYFYCFLWPYWTPYWISWLLSTLNIWPDNIKVVCNTLKHEANAYFACT